MDLNEMKSHNLSIKIVPSMEDSLRSMGLNVELDEFTSAWFKQLKITWKTWKKSPAIENHIETFFHQTSEPFRKALIFIIQCEDYKDSKPKSLPYLLLEILKKWSLANGVLPEDHLKLPAFHIAIHQRNQLFLTLMVKTYYVITIKEKILPIVKDMIKNDNCKQASQIVIAMQLCEDIPVEDLLFPLVLQDKPNLIDDYLLECPSQVKPLLQFLDKLLDKSVSIRQFIQTYIDENNISHVKYDKIHYKPLGKLVARLCNKYNIPIETCKNLSKNRTTGGLRYLIYQKYHEHNVSSSVWEDLVKDSLRQNASSGQEFIDMLIDYDLSEARKWAEYLKIPENLLPLALKNIALNDAPEKEMWDLHLDTTQEFYKLTLSVNKIIIVDTGEKFYNLIMSDVVRNIVVSIDCEWKPSFGATQSQVALIQIATLDEVYLIDALLLNKQEYSSFWCSFYKSFLDNAEIIKVGFGLEQDLKEMKSTVVGLGNIKTQGEGLLDLGTLWKNLLSNGLILPSNSDNGGNSLSSLVQACFGLPLEKSEQCSNWELRPLRQTQITYAALDAYVLLQIYEFLQKLCAEQHINFEEICNDAMVETKKKCPRKPKVSDRLQSSKPVILRSACQVKFFVDPALCNLMPYLRYCGIDSILIPQELLWHDVINLATSEERFIILRKMKYTPNKNFPQNFIVDVNKNTFYQQLRRVLNWFSINVDEDDLFKFCINCNSKQVNKLTPEDVVKICNQFPVVSGKSNHSVQYKPCDDDDDVEDEYANFLDDEYEENLIQPGICQNMNILEPSPCDPIEIYNCAKLVTLNKPGLLCETCGKLFWDEDLLLKPVIKVVFDLINLKIW